MFCLPVSVLPSGSCLRWWISSSDHRPALPPGSDDSHSVDFAGFCLRETMSSWNRSRRHRSIYDSVLRYPPVLAFGLSLCEDWFFCGSSSSSAEFRRLLWFRWKEVVPRLDPCLIDRRAIVHVEDDVP
ncbi:unnamed protein product [Brassica rapa]|uniref:Uncharacterized protein n=1 Tax=Brassica campestris TaxID=3711 RepID=A0A8D9HC86_BRACM|nr:unnamed protein product [Brassica rapa]